MVMVSALLLLIILFVFLRFLTFLTTLVCLFSLRLGSLIVKRYFLINLTVNMVYFVVYENNGTLFYRILPDIQKCLSLVSWHSGEWNQRTEIIPYNPTPRTFKDLKTFISGVYGPERCDLLRQDILEFEFMYNVSLLISDLYE